MPDLIGPRISLAAARRIAIAASGLADPRPDKIVENRHVGRVIDRVGLLQIDSVSVVARAHYLPLFSRLGPYATKLLDEAAWGRKRRLFEYWVHEASLVPLALHPLLRWRMARAANGEGIYGELARFGVECRDFIEGLYEHIRINGPMPASALDDKTRTGGWWGWSRSKRALEWLFWAGRLTAASRRGFERVYDLTERALPASIIGLPTPEPADAHRDLLRLAARALGIATGGDLRDYHRLGPGDANPRIAELVESGELLPVCVDGFAHQAFLHAEARRPRRVDAKALVAPFDPIVWHRPRSERLFGFHYRIEIYTPAAQRRHGYYVLPFLLGESFVARVDLKADRATDTLQVLGAFKEPGAPAHTAEALADELAKLASWLGLENVAVAANGDLSGALSVAVR